MATNYLASKQLCVRQNDPTICLMAATHRGYPQCSIDEFLRVSSETPTAVLFDHSLARYRFQKYPRPTYEPEINMLHSHSS